MGAVIRRFLCPSWHVDVPVFVLAFLDIDASGQSLFRMVSLKKKPVFSAIVSNRLQSVQMSGASSDGLVRELAQGDALRNTILDWVSAAV